MPASKTKRQRHQATSACARCYRLKQKCDKGTPKCSRCVLAGADCVAIHRQTSIEVPRSPLQYLEQRLAELLHLAQSRSASSDNGKAAIASTTDGADGCDPYFVNFAKNCVGKDTTPLLLATHHGLYFQTKLFYPTERPPLKIPVHGKYYSGDSKAGRYSLGGRALQFDALNMPPEVARRLFENYRDNILPRYPCFLVGELESYFNQVFSMEGTNNGVKPELSNFVVNMVLAISCLTYKRDDIHKVKALSESLHRRAMASAGFLRGAGIQSLQCLLLLIQLALLLPTTGNLWFTSGDAIRMAISLGLHQEPQSNSSSQQAHIEFRRRLFWVTYVLDRTVAIAAGCPIALSDEHINTKLPYNGGDPHCGLDDLLKTQCSFRQKQFLLHIHACILQSEIHSIQFFNHPLPDQMPDYNGWIEARRNLTEVLISQITRNGPAPPFLIMATRQCQVLLHRPCSRNMAPSAFSMVAAARASVDYIRASLDIATAGGFIPTFELSNCSFNAAMVLLYVLRNHGGDTEQEEFIQSYENALEDAVGLFTLLSTRWPDVSDTGQYIKDLRETSWQNATSPTQSEYGASFLAELDCLVTHRRIHSLIHRNSQRSFDRPSPLQHETMSESSFTGALKDEAWWNDFINEDFTMAIDHANPAQAAVFEQHEPPLVKEPATRESDDRNGQKSPLHLEEILRAVPACSFCRDRRIKCHRQLPSCRECKRASRECAYYDPVLEENISFTRILSLMEKIQELEAHIPLTSISIHALETYQIPQVLPPRIRRSLAVPFQMDIEDPLTTWIQDLPSSFFGETSPLGFLGTYPPQAFTDEMGQRNQQSQGTLSIDFISCKPNHPPYSLALRLFDIFSKSINVFFPVLEQTSLESLLNSIYNMTGSTQTSSKHANELFYLIIAVSSLLSKRYDPGLGWLGNMWFKQATFDLDPLSNHSSKQSQVFLFQRTILISIYLLLSPKSGDIWRSLGFAIRLFFDLSHRSSMDGEKDQHLFLILTRTLYCLESLVSIAFGRPSLLSIGDKLRNELIVTTEDSPEERISIYFYKISFLKMQLHDVLLRVSNNPETPKEHTDDGHRQWRPSLDDWMVLWKNFVDTIQEETSKRHLMAWAELHYYHALCILSEISPALGSSSVRLCDKISSSATTLTRHQQSSVTIPSRQASLFIYPMNWTTCLTVLGAGSRALCGKEKDITQKDEWHYAITRFLTSLSLLEADPNNLATGLTAVVERAVEL